MIKNALCIAAVMAACAASANEIVTGDKAVPADTNTASTVILSQLVTSRPLYLQVYGAQPTNGTVDVWWPHTDGAGVVRTNTLPTISFDAPGGTFGTNLVSAFADKWIFKQEILYFRFTSTTNGAFQVIGERFK
jgi:hypothetical protein